MANLLDMSAEIMEMIVSLLDFPSICNMRLAARNMSAKATHGIVKSDFQYESVIWTNASQVQALADKTARGWRGCLMKRLDIVGVVEEEAADPNHDANPVVHYAARREVPQRATAAAVPGGVEDRLAQLLMNLKHNDPCGYMDELALRVHRCHEDGMTDSGQIRNWKVTVDVATQTFATAMKALATSRMPVLALDIFGSDSQRFALPWDQLADVVLQFDVQLRPSLRMLTHLSIGMCNSLGSSPEQQASSALLSLIVCCPLLDSLSVRWYDIGRSVSHQYDVMRTSFFTQLALTSLGRNALQRLRRLRLGGYWGGSTGLLSTYITSTDPLA